MALQGTVTNVHDQLGVVWRAERAFRFVTVIIDGTERPSAIQYRARVMLVVGQSKVSAEKLNHKPLECGSSREIVNCFQSRRT